MPTVIGEMIGPFEGELVVDDFVFEVIVSQCR